MSVDIEHVLFVQFGDFRDTYERFARGEAETYRDQLRSVDFVTGLAPERQVTVLSVGAREGYQVELAPNLRAGGRPLGTLSARAIASIFEQFSPSHLVLRTPNKGILREARRRNIRLLPCFADIFVSGGLRQAWKNRQLRHLLSGPGIPCVANHSLNASRSLVSAIGVPVEKVVPWDWSKVPSAGEAKDGLADPARPTAFFAGAMTEEKGVGDCLAAIAMLKKQGINLFMSFAGSGELGHWQNRAEALGILDRVRFLGMIPNAHVRAEMRAHDFVLVPSRHSYAEGLPNTIYEALAARSVLVVSDHPAFMGRLVPQRDCLMFRAGDPESLTYELGRALSDPTTYRRLSENAGAAHEHLYIGMEWPDLISAFLADPENRTGWVGRNALGVAVS